MAAVLAVLALLGFIAWSMTRHSASTDACAGAPSAVDAVQHFYAAIDQALTDQNWTNAYNCFDANYKAAIPFDAFRSGFKTTQASHLLSAQAAGAHMVDFVLCAVDKLSSADLEARKYEGSWLLTSDNHLDKFQDVLVSSTAGASCS